MLNHSVCFYFIFKIENSDFLVIGLLKVLPFIFMIFHNHWIGESESSNQQLVLQSMQSLLLHIFLGINIKLSLTC